MTSGLLHQQRIYHSRYRLRYLCALSRGQESRLQHRVGLQAAMAKPVTKTVGTITSILDPLTSRFTAPSHLCSSLLLTEAGTISGKTLAERVANEQGAGKYTICFPPYWYSHHHKPTNYAYAYSPAVCPHGYTTLGETVMTNGRTTASCCPS